MPELAEKRSRAKLHAARLPQLRAVIQVGRPGFFPGTISVRRGGRPFGRRTSTGMR